MKSKKLAILMNTEGDELPAQLPTLKAASPTAMSPSISIDPESPEQCFSFEQITELVISGGGKFCKHSLKAMTSMAVDLSSSEIVSSFE